MILITGANGQLGSELTEALRKKFGADQVLATDIVEPNISTGPFRLLNVMDRDALRDTIREHNITQIYHLAALLSANAEKQIQKAWNLNMTSLLYVLELAHELKVEKVFWPSSIAVFGPDAPSKNTPQTAALNPTTVYGISKMAGEQWCAYYHKKFGVDVRSLRYPGLIGYKALPGGGTTDYAVDIYHKAVANEPFRCFLAEDARLPMMYMDDAVSATLQLMDAPPKALTIRTSYNVSGMNFTPEEIAGTIQTSVPDFKVSYEPDERQAIADSWPDSIDDAPARRDWGWKPAYDLARMTEEMLINLKKENQAADV
ncbi:MAG: NAD-dependent epimerase/dehydratase family protein [Balneolaceae bacterium]